MGRYPAARHTVVDRVRSSQSSVLSPPSAVVLTSQTGVSPQSATRNPQPLPLMPKDPRNYGSEYRRPSVGALIPGNESAGPFGGYGPPGFAPSSHSEFHGGEYMIGGYPRPYGGTFPPIGDMLGAGGMVISGVDTGATLPAPPYGRAAHLPFGRQRFAGRGPRNYRRSDERITDDVCTCLAMDPELDPSELEVRVEDGEVTLTGFVSDRTAKRRAEDLAETCSGVRDIHNRLKIRRPAERAD